MELEHHLRVDGKTKEKTFKKRDQFAPELVDFSRCIREDREPEPSGEEGIADVRRGCADKSRVGASSSNAEALGVPPTRART